MKKLINKIFPSKESNQNTNALNSRVKEKHQEWHRKIRALLKLSPETESDINCDFDILFDFWKIPKKELLNVFSEIGGLGEIFKEIIDFTTSKKLEDKDFKNYEKLVRLNVTKTIERLSHCTDTSHLDKMDIEFEKGDFHEDFNQSKCLENVTADLDFKIYNEILSKEGELKYSLALFLSEPLYRISTSHLPVYYFNWKLINDSKSPNPYKYLFELFKNYETDVFVSENTIKVYANNFFK